MAQLSAEARRFVLTVKDEYFDFIVAILYDAQFRVDGSKMQLIPKNNSIDEAAVAAVAALALKKKKRDNAAAAANIHYWNHLDHLKGEGDEEVIEMNSQKELEALVFEHVFDFLKKILWFSHVDGGVDGVKAWYEKNEGVLKQINPHIVLPLQVVPSS